MNEKERTLIETENRARSIDYEQGLGQLDQMTDQYERSMQELGSARRQRAGGTALVGSVAGVAAGASFDSIADSIQHIEFMLGDNNPVDHDTPPQTSTSSYIATIPSDEVPTMPAIESSVTPDVTPQSTLETPDLDETPLAESSTIETPKEADTALSALQSEAIETSTLPPLETTDAELDALLNPSVLGEAPTEDMGNENLTPDTIENPQVPQQSPENAVQEAPDATPAETDPTTPAPRELIIVPEQFGGTDTLSETFFEAWKAGQIEGLPEDMTKTQFLNKMYDAINALDGNEKVMALMSNDPAHPLTDMDLVYKNASYNVQPLIDYMNGHSVAEIETGLSAGLSDAITEVSEATPTAPETPVIEEVPSISTIEESTPSAPTDNEWPRPMPRPESLGGVNDGPGGIMVEADPSPLNPEPMQPVTAATPQTSGEELTADEIKERFQEQLQRQSEGVTRGMEPVTDTPLNNGTEDNVIRPDVPQWSSAPGGDTFAAQEVAVAFSPEVTAAVDELRPELQQEFHARVTNEMNEEAKIDLAALIGARAEAVDFINAQLGAEPGHGLDAVGNHTITELQQAMDSNRLPRTLGQWGVTIPSPCAEIIELMKECKILKGETLNEALENAFKSGQMRIPADSAEPTLMIVKRGLFGETPYYVALTSTANQAQSYAA